MDQEPDVVKEDPEAIRHRIEETRSSLTEKLETLEGQVRGTVQGARATVEGTIETVKDTVKETVDSVKRTFDLKYQVAQHPWPMFGGSLVAGLILGSVLPRSGGRRWPSSAPSGYAEETARSIAEPESYSQPYSQSYGQEGDGSRGAGAVAAGAVSAASAASGLVGQLMHQFAPEIQQVKQMAIGTLVGLARDFIKSQVPPNLAPQVAKIMDSATEKLGGKPVSGPVVEPSGTAQHSGTTGPGRW